MPKSSTKPLNAVVYFIVKALFLIDLDSFVVKHIFYTYYYPKVFSKKYIFLLLKPLYFQWIQLK